MGLHLNANLDLGGKKFHIELALVQFKEGDVFIIYSPALDLSGSGYSEKEARDSFSIALEEFVRYTNNKKTLNKVLKDLGWQVLGSNKKPKFTPPKDSDLIASNPLYSDIINSKNYSVSREDIAIPV